MATFVIGDYKYTTTGSNTVAVNVNDRTKSSYEDIPSSVTYGDITYSVTNINTCFQGCTSLTQAPVIPSSVTDMYRCFYGCTSLTQAPTIPNSVTDMNSCFYNCASLTQAPVIPNSVTTMEACFRGCTSLIGDIYILKTSYLILYSNMFYNTVLPITLHSYYDGAQTWANTANNGNVTVGGTISPTVLNTQFIESKKYRVDMLLDCTNCGSITDIIPNGVLYDMNDNQIQFGVGDNNYNGLLRCYAIIEATNQVPNANTSITIKNVAPSSSYTSMSVGTPSTATPSVIKQEGETDPISPTIDVTNVRFNPETTGLNKYTVGDVIGVTTTNMTKSQTNVDNDVKHIVTHASNVRINDTITLQDWITEQYNYLTP